MTLRKRWSTDVLVHKGVSPCVESPCGDHRVSITDGLWPPSNCTTSARRKALANEKIPITMNEITPAPTASSEPQLTQVSMSKVKLVAVVVANPVPTRTKSPKIYRASAERRASPRRKINKEAGNVRPVLHLGEDRNEECFHSFLLCLKNENPLSPC